MKIQPNFLRTALLAALLPLLVGTAWSQPSMTCVFETDADSMFYVDNDYVPNVINITITVTNDGTDSLFQLLANLGGNTRLTVIGANTKPIVPSPLAPGESGTATFQVRLLTADSIRSELTELCAIITSDRISTECCKEIWIEKERIPRITCNLSKSFTEILFVDQFGDYEPNPFEIVVNFSNRGDGRADSVIVKYLATQGLSIDPQNPESRFYNSLPKQQSTDEQESFLINPILRNNDTCMTLIFQIEAIGGYKRKKYVWRCEVEVCVPRAKLPVYEVTCDPSDGFIAFIDHNYDPPQFTISSNVRNIGTATGYALTAEIFPDGGVSLLDDAKKDIADSLGVGEGVVPPVTWTFQPIATPVIDTVCFTIVVTDIFGNRGTAECCVIIDSIRQTEFEVACVCPDTIRVDTTLGEYTPSPFPIQFFVSNVGSDYADNVEATVIVIPPSDGTVTPTLTQQLDATLRPILPGGREDTLTPGNTVMFEWNFEPNRRDFGGLVTFIFEVNATNGEPVQCTCQVYIPPLEGPDVEGTCTIIDPSTGMPIDSLHISSETGGYDPPYFIVRVEYYNDGGGTADNVVGTLVAPENVILKPGESPPETWLKPVGNIAPGRTVVVEWKLIPLPRLESGALIEWAVAVTADNQEAIDDIPCNIFIPRLPITSALAISRDNVTYFGDDLVCAPVFIDNSDTKDIKKFDLKLRYNMTSGIPPQQIVPPVLTFVGADPIRYEQGGIYPPDWSGITVVSVDDYNIHLQFEGPNPLDGYEGRPSFGRLFTLCFKPIFGERPDHLNVAFSEILWAENPADDVLINDGSIAPVLTPGLVTISGDCLRPLDAGPDYVISQNRPNPFNPTTTIDYKLPRDSRVRIEVLDALGRKVAVLVNEFQTAGDHSVRFDATGLPSGMYLYRIEAGNFSKVMKMMVAK